MVVSTIQKSPYYVELEDSNMLFERYTDKYLKEKDNANLASFYPYEILSKYVPTGRVENIPIHSVELVGEKDRKEVHQMRLNIHRTVQHDQTNDKNDEGDNAG